MASSALPPDQASTSAGMAFMREVGLDSGMITGRGVEAAIASMTSRVKAPCTVEEPRRMVGAAILLASTSPTRSATETPNCARFLAYGFRKSRSSSLLFSGYARRCSLSNRRRHGASAWADAAQVCR